MGKGLECGLEAGLWIVIFRARLSSSTPVTCMSCIVRRQRQNVHQAQGLADCGVSVVPAEKDQHFESTLKSAFVLKEAKSQRLKGGCRPCRPVGEKGPMLPWLVTSSHENLGCLMIEEGLPLSQQKNSNNSSFWETIGHNSQYLSLPGVMLDTISLFL